MTMNGLEIIYGKMTYKLRKHIMKLTLNGLIGILSIGIAGILVANGITGWGWFIFITFICLLN